MAKKIVILNGSPRPSGNTAALIEAFTKGAEQAGNGVVRFDVCKMNIHPCLGCCGGGKNPESPCVQKDDMDAIYPHYKDADRLFAVAELSPSYANPVKDCVLLMAAEGDTESNFEPVRHYYHALLERLGWKDCGIVYAGGNMHVGDIAGKPQLEEAEALGASIR